MVFNLLLDFIFDKFFKKKTMNSFFNTGFTITFFGYMPEGAVVNSWELIRSFS